MMTQRQLFRLLLFFLGMVLPHGGMAQEHHTINVSSNLQLTAPGSTNSWSSNPNNVASVSYNPQAPQPTAISVSPQEVELIIGRSKQLTYMLQPEGAVARSVTWATDDSLVCSITQDGLLTALRPGTATITATSENGCKGACRLTVPIAVYQLFLWTKDGEKTGYLTSDMPEFRLNGDVITFSTAKMSMDIPKDDFAKFTMEQVLPEHPLGITLPESLLLGLKRTASLNYTLEPADAVTQVTWLNSAPEVATVTNGGLVTALQPGETILRVQTGNGLRAACRVTVPVPEYRLVVWTRDGKTASYDFATKPEITISGDIFTVASSKTTVSYQAVDILKFTLEDGSLTADLMKGDVTGDCIVNALDIQAVINAAVAESREPRYDLNGDGIVNAHDIQTVINIASEAARRLKQQY